MAKIVINRCFGGFGLSPEALLQLIERGCRVLECQTIAEYTGGGGFGGTLDKFAPLRNGYTVQLFGSSPMDVIVKGDSVWTYTRSNDDTRCDPDMVAVVEALGDAANGPHARLEVVEVPDDVQWTIEEYDGQEHVAEKHRTW